MAKNEINTVQTIKPLNDQRIFLFSVSLLLETRLPVWEVLQILLRRRTGEEKVEKRRDG